MRQLVFVIQSMISFLCVLSVNAGSYVVSNTSAAGPGSFPDAIAWANANSATAPHTITFANSLDGATLPSIVATALTCPKVTIDGTTMTNYSCGNPRIMIQCNTFNGWQWKANNITMKGVRVYGGINITAGTGIDSVYSCVFNIDFAGAAMTGTTAKAAFRVNAVATTVSCVFGGLTGCMRNIVAAVGAFAVVFEGNGDGNQILGNYLGTDAAGLAGFGTSFTTRIIDLEAGNNHVIDGNTMGNVTGTSAGMGIYVNAGTNHTIRNNNIGANANRLFVASMAFGSSSIGNSAVSFHSGAGDNSTMTNNVVGNTLKTNTTASDGNIITVDGPTNVSLNNNYIGCDINFNNGGSTFAGVFYTGGATGGTISGNYIGFCGFTCSLISHGLAFGGAGSVSGTFNITNNYIGVTATGVDIGNGDAGIEINAPNAGSIFNVTGNYIGFNKGLRTTLGASATESAGIRIVTGTTVTISNNYIGTIPGGRVNCGNGWSGIGIEKATTTSITINNNIIAYNSRNAIQTYSAGSDKVLISQNCMFCNANEGIELTNGSLGATAGTGNNSFGRSFTPTYDAVTRSVIISTAGTWKSDFTGNPWVVRGFAPAGSTVEVFQVHHCSSDLTNQTTTVSKANGVQGIDYIGNVVTAANGTWSYNVTANTVKNGFAVTASDLTNKRTSEFSPTVTVTPSCIPPTSVSSATTNATPTCGTNITLSGTSNLVRASCYNNIYYSWLKNGTVVTGPTLVGSPLSVSLSSFDYLKSNVQDPTDDGTYTLRVEDGNAGSATCYVQSAGNAVDVTCALQVKLIDFFGEPEVEQNKIKWILNADVTGYTEVERSTDSKIFTLVQTRYYTSGLKTENIIDVTSDPLVYYRLKVMPNGEKEFYSNIIAVNKNSDFHVLMNQNKPEDWLNMDIIASNDEEINYYIYDLSGSLINEGSFITKSGTSQHSLSIANLPSALYLIKFEEQRTGKTENKKFFH